MFRDLSHWAARLRAVPPVRVWTGLEFAAASAAAGAGAHLIWALVTPVGALGDWRPVQPTAATAGLLADFDPFRRGAATTGGEGVVTGLPLKLFGISLNLSAAGSSAIIEVPEAGQQSFAIGDEVMPGVTLKAVAFDHVVVTRGGIDELLYIDQSTPAETADPAAAPVPGAPAPVPGGISVDAIAAAVRATPRVQNGTVTGVVVDAADPVQLSAAGFQSGDIVTQVNGARVTSLDEIIQQASTPRADGMAIFTIERAGRVETVRTRIAR